MDIKISDLTIAYESGGQSVRPVEGFDLEVHDGELVLLHGPSGSGKTTLLSAIGGLLTPAGGSLLVGGVDVAQLRGAALREHRQQRVGIVFQAFNLIPSLTALENVAAPLLIAGVKGSVARAKAKQLLERVNMGERMDHKPGNLSGGQQQRVAVARALVHVPPLVLADEPTANLDYIQAESVIRLVREIAAPGRMVVVSTHDDRVLSIADQIVELGDLTQGRST